MDLLINGWHAGCIYYIMRLHAREDVVSSGIKGANVTETGGMR